jgi:hypothetical protein
LPLSDSVRAEIDIDAPMVRVRQILGDLSTYSEWNPFTPRVESTLRVGDPIHLHVRLLSDRLSHRVEYVTAIEPDRLCWQMKMGSELLLHAERCQTLTDCEGGGVHYVSEDRFRGLLTPLVMLLFGRAMQRGFEDCASGLKKRAESDE